MNAILLSEEYVSDVKIIGDDLYIGTWVKTVIIRNFWNEVAQGQAVKHNRQSAGKEKP